jgi:hypothetical protein
MSCPRWERRRPGSQNDASDSVYSLACDECTEMSRWRPMTPLARVIKIRGILRHPGRLGERVEQKPFVPSSLLCCKGSGGAASAASCSHFGLWSTQQGPGCLMLNGKAPLAKCFGLQYDVGVVNRRRRSRHKGISTEIPILISFIFSSQSHSQRTFALIRDGAAIGMDRPRQHGKSKGHSWL